MTHEQNLRSDSWTPISWKKRVLWGALIGFALMALFLFGVEGDPAWGPYWKLRPHLVAPAAGAMGGFFLYLMEKLGAEGGWKKILMTLLGYLGYIIALWLGSVLGLDGTLWN